MGGRKKEYGVSWYCTGADCQAEADGAPSDVKGKKKVETMKSLAKC